MIFYFLKFIFNIYISKQFKNKKNQNFLRALLNHSTKGIYDI